MRPSVLTALLVCLAVVGCGSRPAATVPGSAPAPPSSAPMPSRSHVFVIVMENRGYAQVLAAPYVHRLAATYALATNYHGVAHPSLPNYLALTAGSTFGITDDSYHVLPRTGIGEQLTRRGISWRAYMQGMSGGCRNSPYPYAVKHNPFAYYGGDCPANVVPMARLDHDLASGTPRFVWITPDLCNDGHDCSTEVADRFLSTLVPRILASAAFRDRGLLIVTWDEDDGSDDSNQVAAVVAAPDLARHRTSERLDHYSTLASVEDALGVPRLGAAGKAATFGGLFRAAG